MKRFLIGLLVLLCIGIGTTKAQLGMDIQFIGPSKGLPDPNVNGIAQDLDGYIWIATDFGIVRYEGLENYQINVSTKYNQLKSNHVSSVNLDRKGDLWFCADIGLYILKRNSSKIKEFQIKKKNANSVSIIQPNYFKEGKDQTNFIATLGGEVYTYTDKAGLKLVYQSDQNRTQGAFFIRFFGQDTLNKTIWFNSKKNELRQINYETGKVVFNQSYDFDVANLVEDRNGKLFFPTIHSILEFNPNKKTFSEFLPNVTNELNYFIYFDSYNYLWLISSKKNIFKYANGVLENYQDVYKSIIPGYSINITLFEDRMHNMWLGTSKGVLVFHQPQKEFNTFLRSKTKNANSVRCIYENKVDGRIYVTGYDVGGYWDISKNIFVELKELKDIFIYTLLADSLGNLYLGTEGGGLRYYKVKERKIEIVKYDLKKFTERISDFYLTSYRDHLGRVWFGTYNQIYLFDEKSKERINISKSVNGYNLYNGTCMQIYQTKNLHYWLVTNKGLFELDVHLKLINHYSENSPDAFRLSSNNVKKIYEDKNGLIWIGTGSGLNMIDRKLKSVNHYNVTNGLCDNTIVSMIEDRFNRIWLGTNYGLSVFNKSSKLFRNYYIENGLADNEFNHGATYLSANGTFYFGGINGITYFNPADLREHSIPANFLLSGIYTQDKKGNVNVQRFLNSDTINNVFLDYNNRSLKVQFIITDYTRPEKNFYSYKFEGLDENWIDIGNRNFIDFTALNPGDYKLLIRAAGSNGIWNNKIIRINIFVSQVFYKAPWFIIMNFIIVIFIFYGIYLYRIRELKAISNIRLKIASDLHDDVGSVLTSISMQAELMNISDANQRIALSNQILQACRNAVANMRDVIWSIDSRNDNMQNLLDHMKGHLNNMFEYGTTNYTFVYDEQIIYESINVNERQNIYLIFKEAINNILKHSNGTEVKIKLQKKKDELFLSIKDNGTKLEKTENKVGAGLQNMKMRAARINAELNYNTNSGFEIILIRKK